jgi:hypothetical protein
MIMEEILKNKKVTWRTYLPVEGDYGILLFHPFSLIVGSKPNRRWPTESVDSVPNMSLRRGQEFLEEPRADTASPKLETQSINTSKKKE